MLLFDAMEEHRPWDQNDAGAWARTLSLPPDMA
jgi:hypothetical protein